MGLVLKATPDVALSCERVLAYSKGYVMQASVAPAKPPAMSDCKGVSFFSGLEDILEIGAAANGL